MHALVAAGSGVRVLGDPGHGRRPGGHRVRGREAGSHIRQLQPAPRGGPADAATGKGVAWRGAALSPQNAGARFTIFSKA